MASPRTSAGTGTNQGQDRQVDDITTSPERNFNPLLCLLSAGRPPPPLQPAWLGRGCVRPWSEGAAVPRYTAKCILGQKDPHLALLNYRTTPVEAIGYSPARLLMGRELQSRLPIAQPAEEPTWQQAQLRDRRRKMKLETHLNRRRGARDLQQLQPGDRVRIKTEKETSWSSSRSFRDAATLSSSRGARYRRNRRHLMHTYLSVSGPDTARCHAAC